MANPFKLPMARRALANLVSRPATRLYPVEAREPVAAARGHVQVNVATCVFCGLCARRCPAAAITVSREAQRFAIEHLRCVACGVCVDVCNKESLAMSPRAHAVFAGSEAAPDGPSPRGLEVLLKPKSPPAAPAATPTT